MKQSLSLGLFLAVFSLLLFFGSSHSQAADLSVLAPCKRAANTSDVMACVKKRHEESQKQLEKIFASLNGQLSEESQAALKNVQQSWISYRDMECDWEEARAENASLKQIEKLSCLTKITKTRTNLLKTFLDVQEDVQAQELETVKNKLVSFPLWMNALAEDYPDVYWQYGGRFSADLNCDAVEENIMVGLKPGKDGKRQKILSVVQSLPTGRPTSHVFQLDFLSLTEEKDCGGDFEFTVQGGGMAENAEICTQALKVAHKTCGDKYVVWGGKNFVLQNPPDKTASP